MKFLIFDFEGHSKIFKTFISKHTDAEISLHTLLVKYYNNLLGRQSSERGMDEVSYFYVGD